MIGLSGRYRGDEWMSEHLSKLGSKCTLHGVYGLLHGCIAAPCMVMPSKYFNLIFDEEGASFETEEEANEFMRSLMNLWNDIAGWNPEKEPFIRPTGLFSNTAAGLKDRATQYASLIEYFIKGLDLGGIEESDFSEDALDALKSLAEAQGFLNEYARLAERDRTDKDLSESVAAVKKLEGVVCDCIARVNIGLKAARMREVEEMRHLASRKRKAQQAVSAKIGRNAPCPCGSGRKYKKCCGLIH